jgi:hypothetical protein
LISSPFVEATTAGVLTELGMIDPSSRLVSGHAVEPQPLAGFEHGHPGHVTPAEETLFVYS